MDEKWLYISYAIYSTSVLAATLGWAGYAIFVAGHSGWWMIAAFLMCACGYKPHHWRGLVDGVERKKATDHTE